MNMPTPTAATIPQLAEGEIYVGIVANTAGELHHVILLPGDNDDASWQEQMEWAQSIGGDLPTRIEMLFLLENHRDEFERDAYWTCQPDTDPGYSGWAWYQGFYGGSQSSTHQYHPLRARAVRRLPIEPFVNFNCMEGAMHLNSSTGGNVRTLPARKDASADRQQAASDDAALARDERNEEIAECVTFDKLEISTTDCAVIDAALARGRIEDVYAVWGILVAARAAEIARRIAAADLAAVAPRFAMTYCSSCGAELGPGNAGVSSCRDHTAPALRLLSGA